MALPGGSVERAIDPTVIAAVEASVAGAGGVDGSKVKVTGVIEENTRWTWTPPGGTVGGGAGGGVTRRLRSAREALMRQLQAFGPNLPPGVIAKWKYTVNVDLSE